ncbi:MAG: hypothetical protein J7J98_09675 [candidate division Zixibacteria bacterium]|nr:hypothetical protein [candidate division Zixibacteria bacterium]
MVVEQPSDSVGKTAPYPLKTRIVGYLYFIHSSLATALLTLMASGMFGLGPWELTILSLPLWIIGPVSLVIDYRFLAVRELTTFNMFVYMIRAHVVLGSFLGGIPCIFHWFVLQKVKEYRTDIYWELLDPDRKAQREAQQLYEMAIGLEVSGELVEAMHHHKELVKRFGHLALAKDSQSCVDSIKHKLSGKKNGSR